jgi:hypothetical protein
MRRQEWWYALLALTAGVLGGVTSNKLISMAGAAVAPISQRTVAAQQILLVDAKGNTRGALNLSKDGDPGVSLYDRHGRLRTALEMSDADGLGLKLFDTTGALRLALTINIDQIPAVKLFDAQHHPRALMGVDPDGEAALDFYSQEGKLLRELP